MAKLYRNATTNEYYTETAMDGGFVTLRIDSEGSDYLLQEGVEEGSRIPGELMAELEQRGWVSVVADAGSLSGDGDVPLVNESETNAPPYDGQPLREEPLPSVRMEPRPWMEPENVERAREATGTQVAGTDQAEPQFVSKTAERQNADALNHPEAAAFIGGVWFWVLIVAVVVIAVWGLVEIF